MDTQFELNGILVKINSDVMLNRVYDRVEHLLKTRHPAYGKPASYYHSILPFTADSKEATQRTILEFSWYFKSTTGPSGFKPMLYMIIDEIRSEAIEQVLNSGTLEAHMTSRCKLEHTRELHTIAVTLLMHLGKFTYIE